MVPKIEAAARTAPRARRRDPPRSGQQEPRGVPGLYVLLTELEKLALDTDWAWFLRWFLLGPPGVNIRNEVAHGFVSARCSGLEFRAVDVPTEGVLRTFTIVAFAAEGVQVPFVAGVVDCEGTSVRGNVVNAPPDPAHLTSWARFAPGVSEFAGGPKGNAGTG